MVYISNNGLEMNAFVSKLNMYNGGRTIFILLGGFRLLDIYDILRSEVSFMPYQNTNLNGNYIII